MYDRRSEDVLRTAHHLVPIQNFCIFGFPVKNSNRCVKQELLHLKNTFFIELSIFCWFTKSSLKVAWRSPGGPGRQDLQGTLRGRPLDVAYRLGISVLGRQIVKQLLGLNPLSLSLSGNKKLQIKEKLSFSFVMNVKQLLNRQYTKIQLSQKHVCKN